MSEKATVVNVARSIKLIVTETIATNPKAYPLKSKEFGFDYDAYNQKSYLDPQVVEIQRLHGVAVTDHYDLRQRLVELDKLFVDLAYCYPNDKAQKILDQREELNTTASIAEVQKEHAETIIDGLKAENDMLDAQTKIFKKKKEYREEEIEFEKFENQHFKRSNEAKVNDAVKRAIEKDPKHAAKTIKEADKAKRALRDSDSSTNHEE